MLAKAVLGRVFGRSSTRISTALTAPKSRSATPIVRSYATNNTNSFSYSWNTSFPSAQWFMEARQSSIISPGVVRPFDVPEIEGTFGELIVPSIDSQLVIEPVLEATSTLRKRKTKMNNHKRRKRLKKQRFLMRKLGKI